MGTSDKPVSVTRVRSWIETGRWDGMPPSGRTDRRAVLFAADVAEAAALTENDARVVEIVRKMAADQLSKRERKQLKGELAKMVEQVSSWTLIAAGAAVAMDSGSTSPWKYARDTLVWADSSPALLRRFLNETPSDFDAAFESKGEWPAERLAAYLSGDIVRVVSADGTPASGWVTRAEATKLLIDAGPGAVLEIA